MDFFLDDGTTPIRLIPVNAQLPAQAQRRAVPGYPYIRLANDEFDDSYPLDAFQTLRSAYTSPSLRSLQTRMEQIQQQRARAQLQRSLLEQQLREQAQRDHELRLIQERIIEERRKQARAAALRAKKAYLDGIEDQKRQKLLEEQQQQRQQQQDNGDAFLPPFRFFNHIINNQLKSHDEFQRKRAQKVALEDLLQAYFGAPSGPCDQSAEAAQGVHDPSPSEPAPSEPQSQPEREPESWPLLVDGKRVVDPSILDNVLRVVHNRLSEIADEEDEPANDHHDNASAGSQNPGSDSETPDTVHVDVIEEPTEGESSQQPSHPALPPSNGSGDQKGVEVEEPVDYKRLADALRTRVDGLDAEKMYVPPSPHIDPITDESEEEEEGGRSEPVDHSASEKQRPPAAEHKDAPASTESPKAFGVIDPNASDDEFSRMLDNCKRQLCDLQEVESNPHGKSARRRRRHRNRRRHHKSVVADTKPNSDAVKPLPAETEEDRQKRAVHTIEDFVLGIRDKTRAKQTRTSLEELRKIERSVDDTRKKYTELLRNTQLSFVTDSSGNLKLAFDKHNLAFHEFQEVLQRLLFRLDEIPSHGDEVVRYKRRAVVKKIQSVLDALDQFAADQESELSEATNNSSWADESSDAE